MLVIIIISLMVLTFLLLSTLTRHLTNVVEHRDTMWLLLKRRLKERAEEYARIVYAMKDIGAFKDDDVTKELISLYDAMVEFSSSSPEVFSIALVCQKSESVQEMIEKEAVRLVGFTDNQAYIGYTDNIVDLNNKINYAIQKYNAQASRLNLVINSFGYSLANKIFKKIEKSRMVEFS